MGNALQSERLSTGSLAAAITLFFRKRMGNKMSQCTRPSPVQDPPLDGYVPSSSPAVAGLGQPLAKPASVGTERTPPKLMDTKKPSSEYRSDVHADKPALISGLVHAYHIDKFDAKYDLSDSTLLGQGTCGYVCTVKSRLTGATFALKEISLDKIGGSMSSLRKEIELQKKLDHPNICKILESFEDRKHGRVYIVMELCTGGSLVSRMKTHRHGYGEHAAATLVEKMLSAILYCHHHGVVHRDIKLDNMIYEDEREDAELKLIDFGFARAVRPGSETMHDQLGTPSYMAPELWAERDTPYNSSVDMWAIGVVAYMLLSGQRPFHSQDKREKARMIRYDPVRFPDRYWAHVSAEAKEFCIALMKKDPSERLSASEAVKHPWITSRSRAHSGDNGLDAAHELERHNEIVQSLQSFTEGDDLKKLALEVIAFSTPPSQLEELRHLFQKMDEDDSGTISLDEFKHAMAMHPEIPDEKVEKMFTDMDSTHSGEIDYTEFLAATVSSQKVVASGSIKSAFAMLDCDGDGYITKPDLENAFDGCLAEKSLGRFLHCSDESGRISYDSFKKMLRTGTPTPSNGSAGASNQEWIDAINLIKRRSADSQRRSVEEDIQCDHPKLSAVACKPATNRSMEVCSSPHHVPAPADVQHNSPSVVMTEAF